MDNEEKIQKAIETFRKPYSCAQTVYAACLPMDAEKAEMLKSNSGGRAPEGICGALFAAKLISKKSPEELESEFAKFTGATQCKVIKGVHKTPCEECVRAAMKII